MNLSIIGIVDRGDLQNERVHLRALSDLNLTRYVLFDTQYITENAIKTGSGSCHWFGVIDLKKGDSVVIYTRIGAAPAQDSATGKVHFVFRGLSEPMYSDPSSSMSLLELADWTTAPVQSAQAKT